MPYNLRTNWVLARGYLGTMTHTLSLFRITIIFSLLSGGSLTAANAALISIDLSGASTGTLINAPGASFAQTFSGQSVAGTGITGSPTGPLSLSGSGIIMVNFFSPPADCGDCAAGNSLLSGSDFRAPLSILFDQQADSFNWVMGFASPPSSITIDLFASTGSLVNTVVRSMSPDYAQYSLSGLGSFAGITFRDNNARGGLRFQDMSYNSVSAVPVPAVPVPAAIWLFGTGLIGLIGFSKRRKAV